MHTDEFISEALLNVKRHFITPSRDACSIKKRNSPLFLNNFMHSILHHLSSIFCLPLWLSFYHSSLPLSLDGFSSMCKFRIVSACNSVQLSTNDFVRIFVNIFV